MNGTQYRYFNIESLVGDKYIDISEADAIKEASSILSRSVKRTFECRL